MHEYTNKCMHTQIPSSQSARWKTLTIEILLIKHGVCATNKEQYKNNKEYLYHKKKSIVKTMVSIHQQIKADSH